MSGRELWAGVGFGFAAALRATPLVFLPYLLWRRHFVAAAAFAVAFLIASFLPDLFFTPVVAQHGYFVTWLREVAGASFGVDPGSAKLAFWSGANIMNHSLHGAVSLNLNETTQHSLHSAVLYAIDAAFIIVVGTMIVLSPNRRELIATMKHHRMAAAVDNRDSNVPVILLGLCFCCGHCLLGLVQCDRRAVVTNT